MRGEVARLLPDTAEIQTRTTTSDGAGGWSEAWSTAATVACRVDPFTRRGLAGTNIEQAGGREALRLTYTVTLPHDAPITVGTRIITGGFTYEVRQLIGEHSWRVSRRALIVRID
jgi:head-tail adaptor